MKENRSPITSASHWDRVLKKRREWREKRVERKEKRLQKTTELLSEEDARKDSPVEEKTVVVNGGTKGGKRLAVGTSEWNLRIYVHTVHVPAARWRDFPCVLATFQKLISHVVHRVAYVFQSSCV